MDLVATIYPGNVHTVLNLQAGEGGGGAGGGGARRAPPPAASERGDDARRPCEVGAFDPRSAAAAAWRQRYVRTRIEVGDNQIQIGMGDKSKWATTRFESKQHGQSSEYSLYTAAVYSGEHTHTLFLFGPRVATAGSPDTCTCRYAGSCRDQSR